MAIISIFHHHTSLDKKIIQKLQERTKYALLDDDLVVETAARMSGFKKEKIKTAFTSKTSVFHSFTHEKDCSIAYLKLALADGIGSKGIILHGYCALLLPLNFPNTVRIALKPAIFSSATPVDRTPASLEADCGVWVKTIHQKENPWDASLYDLSFETDRVSPDQLADNILEYQSKFTEMEKSGLQAVEDFKLSSIVNARLIKSGHNVGVRAGNGAILITINKPVLMLNRVEDDIRSIVEKVDGVKSVQVEVNLASENGDAYQPFNRDLPSKVLLVDDEREFVQTLSERLQMREMGSAVVFDGQSALECMKNDDPEVMIIDLRMPGIDGIQVLREVKQQKPEIEVIVLTGHGSEKDKATCMELGAFAYFQKPVDIDRLSDALKQAHRAIQKRTAKTF